MSSQSPVPFSPHGSIVNPQLVINRAIALLHRIDRGEEIALIAPKTLKGIGRAIDPAVRADWAITALAGQQIEVMRGDKRTEVRGSRGTNYVPAVDELMPIRPTVIQEQLPLGIRQRNFSISMHNAFDLVRRPIMEKLSMTVDLYAVIKTLGGENQIPPRLRKRLALRPDYLTLTCQDHATANEMVRLEQAAQQFLDERLKASDIDKPHWKPLDSGDRAAYAWRRKRADIAQQALDDVGELANSSLQRSWRKDVRQTGIWALDDTELGEEARITLIVDSDRTVQANFIKTLARLGVDESDLSPIAGEWDKRFGIRSEITLEQFGMRVVFLAGPKSVNEMLDQASLAPDNSGLARLGSNLDRSFEPHEFSWGVTLPRIEIDVYDGLTSGRYQNQLSTAIRLEATPNFGASAGQL